MIVDERKYEVWVQTDFGMQRWSDVGGVYGPMLKKTAEAHAAGLRGYGVTAEVRLVESEEVRSGGPAKEGS